MTDQHPAVTFLLAAHERAVALADAGTPGPWMPEGDDPTDDEIYTVHDGEHGDLVGEVVAYVRGGNWRGGADRTVQNMQLITAFADPTVVLARVAAERDILADHTPTPRDSSGEYCSVCSQSEEHPQPVGWWVPYPCRTVLGLAKAWGWKEPT